MTYDHEKLETLYKELAMAVNGLNGDMLDKLTVITSVCATIICQIAREKQYALKGAQNLERQVSMLINEYFKEENDPTNKTD